MNYSAFTPEDDPIPLEKIQPWIDMMRELLLESHLSGDTIMKLMRMYAPKKHHHAIKPIGPTKRRTFHYFSKLPSKVRFTIWRMAAARPPKVLFWQNDYDEGGPPPNSPADGPLAAMACKEAWNVIQHMGFYFDMQGVDPDSSTERARPVQFAHHDLVFTPYGVSTKPCDSEPEFRAHDLLRIRKALAVDYDDFVISMAEGYHPARYNFLAETKQLETLVCIMAAPEVCIWTENDNKDASPGLTGQQLQRTKICQKIVLLQDMEEVRKVDVLWRNVKPEWRWLSRPNCDHFRVNAAAYAPKLQSRCYNCAVRHWKETCVPQLRRTCVRALYTEGFDRLCDEGVREKDPYPEEEIYPHGLTGEPNPNHPWVKKALARMPKFRPAMLLMFKKRAPRYDEMGRCINRMNRKGY
ncbi:predicted protein [Chaetomium globosum CBS 148.51]|uniref:2EXR domain-containing protein n=1 Tax=Chaetomium globosum (strain ATCC 6205 / CBS 148.51 / DSM 1962 / NBRC 6347 / NRRL 1970) TaxID=306901 RepID=Q2GRV2_CHAGB|nr:uncharacterized protein CHGG_09302 [Chaetomium globosum CBS 148.51]EAQ85288.1 predicted protein [Chaetomium globosum CBS 148.51]